MITQQRIQGNWNELKGRLREKWGQLTDDDLSQTFGNVEQLVGFLQRKTGESREAVEYYLEKAMSRGSTMVSDAAEGAKQYADQAMQAAQGAYQEMGHQMQAGLKQAERTIRRHPMESLAVCFGAGLVAGVVVTILMRNSR